MVSPVQPVPVQEVKAENKDAPKPASNFNVKSFEFVPKNKIVKTAEQFPSLEEGLKKEAPI